MKIKIAFLIFITWSTANAQQDPLYAQYYNNPLLINPAFAGTSERLYMGLAYRSQWTGIDGGPTTLNFNSHIAVANNKVGLGLIVADDKAGDAKSSQYSGAFAYHIKLPSATFSFGLQAGLLQYTTNLSGVNPQFPDVLFAPMTETSFNLGAGLLVKSDRYSIGLSVPHLIAHGATVNQGAQSIKVQISSQNYYLFGSYNFQLNERIEFKPSTLIRLTKGAPLSVDVNAIFAFNRLYSAGLFTRNLNTYGLMIQGIFNNMRLGYVFEVPGKNAALNYSTHEISLALSLAILTSHNHVITGL